MFVDFLLFLVVLLVKPFKIVFLAVFLRKIMRFFLLYLISFLFRRKSWRRVKLNLFWVLLLLLISCISYSSISVLNLRGWSSSNWEFSFVNLIVTRFFVTFVLNCRVAVFHQKFRRIKFKGGWFLYFFANLSYFYCLYSFFLKWTFH